jgi:hypothetical protein
MVANFALLYRKPTATQEIAATGRKFRQSSSFSIDCVLNLHCAFRVFCLMIELKCIKVDSFAKLNVWDFGQSLETVTIWVLSVVVNGL